MSLKRRIAFNLALLFSLLFGACTLAIYYSFANFRREEFRDRLEQKAITTAKILLEIDEINPSRLRRIDENSIDQLFQEHTLIYNDSMQLIYNSKSTKIPTWNGTSLKMLKVKKRQFQTTGQRDILSIYYDFQNADYFVIISARDIHGISKLEFLFYSLIITFFGATILIWVFTYFVVKKLVKPLDDFQESITKVSVNQLYVPFKTTQQSKEIEVLTKAFNRLMKRLDKAFISQKEFTANASHELRTPITRIAFQLENLKTAELSIEAQQTIAHMTEDIYQLSELLHSLLLLSKISDHSDRSLFQPLRIDESIFDAFEHVKKQFPAFDLTFEIEETPFVETTMEIQGVASLIEIGFINLLKNACIYSANQRAHVLITQTVSGIIVRISNNGDTLLPDEIHRLFTSFSRFSTAKNTPGSGLGLGIVKRILDYHSATIEYVVTPNQQNEFRLVFHNA
jgi:two-component system sensor histidine kinase ArlS